MDNFTEECKSCGAKIEYQAGSQSLVCPYCGTKIEIKKAEDEVPVNAQAIIPLSLTAEELEKRVLTYIAKDNYAPDDMLESMQFIRREGLYAPAYLFRVDYEAVWTASFGYNRREYRGRGKNGDVYETVTDWRPMNGTDAGSFEIAAYAGNELSEVELNPADIVSNTAVKGDVTAFNPAFMKDIKAEKFSIPEKAAFESLKQSIDAKIDENVKKHAQGDKQRDWNWRASFNTASKTVYVPLSCAIFDYDGKNYSYWADGISGEIVKADKLPVDSQRQGYIRKGFIPAIVGALGGIYAFINHHWLAGIVAILIGLGYAFVRRGSILGYSKKIRESLVTQKYASSMATGSLSEQEQLAYAQAFQVPAKPFLAKTEKDSILLPIVSVIAAVVALFPVFFGGGISKPARAPIAAPKPMPQTQQVAQKAPEPVQTKQTNPLADYASLNNSELSAFLKSAENNQWASVRNLADSMMKSSELEPLGDKKTLARAQNRMGQQDLQRNRISEAIGKFSSALRLSPGNYEIKNNLAQAHMLNGDLAVAEGLVSEILMKAPNRANTWQTLAQILARTAESSSDGYSALMGASQSALKLAAYFAPDKGKMRQYMDRVSQNHPVSAYRETVSTVLRDFDNIPSVNDPQSVADNAPPQVPETTRQPQVVREQPAPTQNAEKDDKTRRMTTSSDSVNKQKQKNDNINRQKTDSFRTAQPPASAPTSGDTNTPKPNTEKPAQKTTGDKAKETLNKAWEGGKKLLKSIPKGKLDKVDPY